MAQPSHMMMGGRFQPPQMPSRPAMPSPFFMGGGMPSAAASMMQNFAPPMPSMSQYQLGMQMRAGMSQALQHMSQMNQMNTRPSPMMASAMIPGRPPMGRSSAMPMSTIIGMRKIAQGNMGMGTAPVGVKKCFKCGRNGHVATFCQCEYRLPRCPRACTENSILYTIPSSEFYDTWPLYAQSTRE
jgi:hypothetical protein